MLELDAAGYYQQAGKLWPFDNGYGVYARASADIYDFRVKTSYWRCHQFISMFGSPFYGAVSTSDEGLTFDDPSCVYFGLEYSRELAKALIWISMSICLSCFAVRSRMAINHLPKPVSLPGFI